MGRKPCCENVGLKKGPWSEEEDKKLIAYVEEHGHGNWRSVPVKAGLQRCGKSCRLRWINYLKPDIKRGNFSLEEDRTIIQLHALLGNKWSIIAAHLHKRTDNEIKNYWHSHLKKRLIKMGIDPTTHKPKANTIADQSKDATIISHMAQWESTRLEAEARESMLQLVGSCSSSHPAGLIISKIPPQPSQPPCLDVLKAWQISRSSETPPSSSSNTMYNMYAIMLATDDLQSPVSTLSFPGCKLPMSSNNVGKFTNTSLSYEDDRNVIEYNSDKVREGIESSSQDDDIMVAVEAFRAARQENIPDLANFVIEGLNEDMPGCDSYETFTEEYGYGNLNLDWNGILMNLDNYSPSRGLLPVTIINKN